MVILAVVVVVVVVTVLVVVVVAVVVHLTHTRLPYTRAQTNIPPGNWSWKVPTPNPPPMLASTKDDTNGVYYCSEKEGVEYIYIYMCVCVYVYTYVYVYVGVCVCI